MGSVPTFRIFRPAQTYMYSIQNVTKGQVWFHMETGSVHLGKLLNWYFSAP